MRNAFVVAATALLFSAACVEDNDNDTDQTTAFLGTWVNTTGSSTFTCPGQEVMTSAIDAGEFDIDLTKKSNSEITIALDFSGNACSIDAMVSGSVATIKTDSTCTFTAFSMKFKSGSFTMSTATTASMTIDSDQSAQNMTCDADFTFGLTKQ
jgi:hypothetical protein